MLVSTVVVPFLLNAIVMMSDQTDVDKVQFEYTFQIDVRSLFLDYENLAENRVTYLSVDLKCHDAFLGLMCRLGRYKRMQPVPKEQLSYSDRNVIDHRIFQTDGKPFQINFSRTGINGYVVERDAIPTRTMNVYRMIADHFNVGGKIRWRRRNFRAIEQSYIGSCPTRFKIMAVKPSGDLNITLISLVDLNLENNKVLVVKRRNVAGCLELSHYSFSARLWPEFVPRKSTSHILVRSDSSLKMSARSFETVAENVFNFYDGHMKEVGDVLENVQLRLISYRQLPENHAITFDEKKTVLLPVINDDKA